MTKKMKRDRTPTPVDDSVAEAMEVRLAYKNLIDSFADDQKTLEQRINEQAPQNHGSNHDHANNHPGDHGNDHSNDHGDHGGGSSNGTP